MTRTALVKKVKLYYPSACSFSVEYCTRKYYNYSKGVKMTCIKRFMLFIHFKGGVTKWTNYCSSIKECYKKLVNQELI